VRKARIKPGEEVSLKAAVRAMEAQRATAEQCHTARQIVAGDGSGTGLEGGLAGGLRQLEQQLKGVLAREAQAASAAGVWRGVEGGRRPRVRRVNGLRVKGGHSRLQLAGSEAHKGEHKHV